MNIINVIKEDYDYGKESKKEYILGILRRRSFQVKSVYGGYVWGYGYSRQGTKNDEIEKLSVKDFLQVCKPCNVQLTRVIDKNGAVIHEECERILINGK